MKNITRYSLVIGAVVLAVIVVVALRCNHVADGALGFQFPPPVSTANTKFVYNVKSYGATGDGSTDDRVTVLAAMNAACSAGGGEVHFPAGTYITNRNGANSYSTDLPCGNLTLTGVHGKSWIKHPVGMPNSSVSLLRIDKKSNVTIRDLGFDGNWGNAVTTITSSSDAVVLPQATINVKDTSLFPASGPIVVMSTSGTNYVTCSGKTSTTFTGCSGGVGSVFIGYNVGYVNANVGINHISQADHFTTIASGSNGVSLPTGTINVASTAGFPTAASLRIYTGLGWQSIAYTGVTGTSFTGCTGGLGVMSTGGAIETIADAQNHGVMIRGSDNVTIQDSNFKQIYGDCIWMGSASTGGVGNGTVGVRIINTDCDMGARQAFSFAQQVTGAVVDHCRMTNYIGHGIDSEPVTVPVRDIVIENNTLGGWWDQETIQNGGIELSAGNANAGFTQQQTARNWRIKNNLIIGTTHVLRTTDVVFENNRFVQNFSANASSPLIIEMTNEDVTVQNNYFYTRSQTSGIDGNGDSGAVVVYGYASGAIHYTPTTIRILNNTMHVRNGRSGIVVLGSGGLTSTDSGTATAVTTTTMADSGKSWTTNQWSGAYVRIGTAMASITSNTGTTLTLVPSTIGGTSAWVTQLGDQTVTPATGAYTIQRNLGLIDIADNQIEGRDDGNGKGKYGINITSGANNQIEMRVRIRHNVVSDINVDAIRVKFDGGGDYPYVEITDNHVFDDQPTPTTTNMLTFQNAIRATKFIMRGNTKGEGVTNATSGLAAGTWLVTDGMTQEWAGYGSPETIITAPIGSVYLRIDGSGTTATYTKTSGTGNTGWLVADGAVTSIAASNGVTVAGTAQIPTVAVTGLAAAANHSIIQSDGAGGSSWLTTAVLTLLTTSGHHDAKGTSPALSACGTGPAISGDDLAGTVTEGTIATGCVITFASVYGVAPTCSVTSESALTFTYTTSTSAITVTNVGALSSTKIDYVCHGH